MTNDKTALVVVGGLALLYLFSKSKTAASNQSSGDYVLAPSGQYVYAPSLSTQNTPTGTAPSSMDAAIAGFESWFQGF